MRFIPRWRKATWALLIWNILIAVWIIGGAGNVSNNCAGKVGDALTACQAGTAIGGGIAVTLIVIIWFLGFIVLGLIWLMSRSRDNVLIYGPQGQQVTVSEKEAKKRTEKQGWTYTPREP